MKLPPSSSFLFFCGYNVVRNFCNGTLSFCNVYFAVLNLYGLLFSFYAIFRFDYSLIGRSHRLQKCKVAHTREEHNFYVFLIENQSRLRLINLKYY